jgi:hypothetical protein
MKLTRAFLFSLTLVSASYARLGETEAELIARFGQPKGRTTDKMGAQGQMWDIGPKYIFYQDGRPRTKPVPAAPLRGTRYHASAPARGTRQR